MVLMATEDSRSGHRATFQRDPMESILRWMLATILGVGMSTLALLMLGVMRPWLAWPLGIVATLAFSPLLPKGNGRPVARDAGIGVIVVASAVAVLGWVAPHEHVLGGRDAGTYIATAAWASHSGTLVIPSGIEVLGESELRYESAGFAASTDGRQVYPQFMHLFPGLMALAASSFGMAAMLWVNPALGAVALFALFGFARRVVSDRLAFIVCLLVALALPFTYFSRAPFSEPLAMLLVFGGLWALGHAVERRSLRYAAGAGVLLGAVLLARIDGLLVILALTGYLTWQESVTPDDPDIPVVRRAWLVSSLAALVGLFDGLVFSPVYIANHAGFIGGTMAAILAVRVAGSALGAGRRAGWLIRHRVRIATGLSGVIGLWLIYAWLIRPHVETPTKGDVYGLEALQRAAGVAVEPLRSYAELSVRWLGWYLGVVVLGLGLAGMVLRLRTLLATGDSRSGAFVVVLSVSTLTYLYRPSINPDQIWAVRRYVPVIIPGLILVGVWLAARLIGGGGSKRVALAVLVGSLFVAPILTTSRVGTGAELAGAGEATNRACSALGADAVVLFTGEAAPVGDVFMPLLRGWCGIPVAAETPENPLGSDDLARLAGTVGSQGRTLWEVSGESLGGDPPPGTVALFDESFPYLEGTLFGPPRDWQTLQVTVGAVEVEG